MLSEFQRRKAEQHFTALDTNGDGVLTIDDLVLGARRLLELQGDTPDQVTERLSRFDEGLNAWWDLLTRMDRNGDGEISPQEFLHGYERVLLDSDDYRSAARAAAGARFDLGDLNGDGVLSEEEFVALFRISFGIPRETAAPLFARFLPDGQLTLSRDVYVRHAMEFLTGDDPDAPGSALLGPLPALRLDSR